MSHAFQSTVSPPFPVYTLPQYFQKLREKYKAILDYGKYLFM